MKLESSKVLAISPTQLQGLFNKEIISATVKYEEYKNRKDEEGYEYDRESEFTKFHLIFMLATGEEFIISLTDEGHDYGNYIEVNGRRLNVNPELDYKMLRELVEQELTDPAKKSAMFEYLQECEKRPHLSWLGVSVGFDPFFDSWEARQEFYRKYEAKFPAPF